MSRWMLMLSEKCAPIVTLLDEHIRSGPLIGMDETQTQVLGEEDRADTATSYMWLARGGPPGKIVVRFMYHPTVFRQVKIPQKSAKKYPSDDGYFYPVFLPHEGMLHAVTLSFEQHDIAMMSETVDHGGCHLVVGHD